MTIVERFDRLERTLKHRFALLIGIQVTTLLSVVAAALSYGQDAICAPVVVTLPAHGGPHCPQRPPMDIAR